MLGPYGRLCLAANDVDSVVAVCTQWNVGVDALYQAAYSVQHIGDGVYLKLLIFPVCRVSVVLYGGERHPAGPFVKPALTVFTLADPHIVAVVICGGVAGDIEENAVQRIVGHGLTQDIEDALLLVGAIDTDRCAVFKVSGVSVRPASEPVRICLEIILVYLADVKPRNHADTGGMTFFDDLAKFIALQIRRGTLAGKLGRPIGADAAAAYLHYVGTQLFQHIHLVIHVHSAVNVPQIVLNHTVGLFHPPIHRNSPF